MVQSDRSRPDKPRKGAAPRTGPRKGGPAPKPRKPGPGRPVRAPAPAAPPARSPSAARPETLKPRLKKRGKSATAVRAARPDAALDGGPVIDRPPAWKRALDWLLEDPSKAKREGPTEREKALAKVAEQDRERRRALMRSAFRRKRGAGAVAGVSYVGPAAWPRAPLVAKPHKAPLPKGAARGATAKPMQEEATARPPRKDRPKDKKPFPLVSAWHALLGERHHKDRNGQKVVVPPAETDWRWNLHRFFRSNVRAVVYARSLLLLLLVLSSAWVSLYATTGYDYIELASFGAPSEDPRDRYKLPFFIIESGSMMHPDAPWGRVGTVDPGDLVVLEKYHDDMRIETFYGDGDRHVAGAKGDVIMYLPYDPPPDVEPVPIIHRAIAYIQRDTFSVPNPDYPGPGQQQFIQRVRFTVEEFGIVNAHAVTIPELGLYNYMPGVGGYITRGDNPRSNNWADQALGVTPFPVPKDRIIGRMKAEVPVVGLAKIALSGQDPRVLSVDGDWCDFLAGKAACDTWQLFFLVTIVIVGIPLLVTFVIFGRRLWQRRLDLIALRLAAARTEQETKDAEKGRDDDAEGPALPRHDATDLLSGKVRVVAATPTTGPTRWEDLTRSQVRFDGGDPPPSTP